MKSDVIPLRSYSRILLKVSMKTQTPRILRLAGERDAHGFLRSHIPQISEGGADCNLAIDIADGFEVHPIE